MDYSVDRKLPSTIPHHGKLRTPIMTGMGAAAREE
jgi:hypothetical protein